MSNNDVKKANESNKELIEKYPFLMPRDIYTGKIDRKYDYSYMPYEFTNGWKNIWWKLVESLGSEYNNLSEEKKAQFSIIQTKEKFGEMRCYTSFETKGMANAINKASFLSRYTCISCGKQPKTIFGQHKIWVSRGWISPFCKDCAKTIGKCDKEISPNKMIIKSSSRDIPSGYYKRTVYKVKDITDINTKDGKSKLVKENTIFKKLLRGLK